MKKFWKKGARAALALALVFAIAIALMSALGAKTPALERAMQAILTPLRSGVTALTNQAEQLYSYLFRYEALQAENEALKAQIADMEYDARTADAYQRENQRLKELLDLTKEHEDYDLVSAYIITWDSNNWKSSFTINKGSASGIETGMVAITARGEAVGMVTDVGKSWATVTTVLDSSLEISAQIASSGYAGMVQGAYVTGSEGMLRMNYLPTDAVIRNNDQVVTSGSTVYPRDLILGYVADAGFDESGVAKYAILTPAADFENMEQVFILTNYVNE